MPPRKKRASEPSTPGVVPAHTPALPSALLAEAHDLLPPAAFWSLLHPFLPDLDLLPTPVFASIESAFGAAIRAQKAKSAPRDLRYASRQTKWKARIKALEKDCEEEGSNYEQQWEDMNTIAEEVVAWLKVLFAVGIEEKDQFLLVHKCFLLADEVMQNLSSVDSEMPFKGRENSYQLDSATLGIVYKTSSWKELQIKLWRDLLLAILGEAGTENAAIAVRLTAELAKKERAQWVSLLVKYVREED